MMVLTPGAPAAIQTIGAQLAQMANLLDDVLSIDLVSLVGVHAFGGRSHPTTTTTTATK